MRNLFLIPALVLALAACSSSSSTSSEAPATQPADAIAVSVADFMIDPSDLSVAGPSVAFDVTNDGPTPHNFSVRTSDGEVVLATEDLGVGATETLSGTLEPGDYLIFCSLAGHESLGMSGTLTVTASDA
jgi:plastocyanin